MDLVWWLFFALLSQGETSGGGAIAIKDTKCYLYEGGHRGITTDMQEVKTSSGSVKLTCQFKEVANPPAKVETFKGFPCGSHYGVTTDTMAVVTPSGNATLTCMIKPAP